MRKDIYTELYESRFLSDSSEIEIFEKCLELLSEDFTEDDIGELCSIFEDRTCNAEVMFGAVHLLETLSSETAFENTVRGVVEMSRTSPEWAETIICRCLNDDFSVRMINRIKNRPDAETWKRFGEILMRIKNRDEERFGRAVDMIVR